MNSIKSPPGQAAGELDGCRIVHQRLRAVVYDLGDSEVARPSWTELPGWSVGHVVTHLARNAEAMCRRMEGAIRSRSSSSTRVARRGARPRSCKRRGDERRYPRRCDRSVVTTRLDELVESLDNEAWGRRVRTVAGNEHPVAFLPFRRWREFEVHLVGLRLHVNPADWPDGLVERALPRLIAGLADRTDERELMAWARSDQHQLTPFG